MAEQLPNLTKAFDSFDTLAKKQLAKNTFQATFLKDIDTAQSKMTAQIRSCDANSKAFLTAPKELTNAKSLTEQVKQYDLSAVAFQKEVTAAIPLLQKRIDQQKSARDSGISDADGIIKGLKVLKTGLDAIAKTNDQWLANSKTAINDLGKQFDLQANIAKNMKQSLTAGVARGLAAAQRIKATPTYALYSTEFPNAGRDITQPLGNIGKLIAAGKMTASAWPANHQALFQQLAPFAGNLTIPNTSDSKVVLAEITKFNKAVKDVVLAFKL